MNSRQLVHKTLNFDSPERIPRQMWILPWAEDRYPDQAERIRKTFPDDIVTAEFTYKKQLVISGEKYGVGDYTDEWGCKFSNVHDGVIGIVLEPLIATWDDLDKFKPPEETLTVNVEEVNAFCLQTDKFVLSGGSICRPFERFQFLRTMEQALVDLVQEPQEMTELLNCIHEHYCKEVEIWANTEVDAISFMDDWGMQNRLLASPDTFRKYFKPMYREYADIAHQCGKYLFMHSDGYITDIIPDLIKVGIDALNSQLFCMDIEELGGMARGEITFWGEIDRQHLLPRGSKQDIKDAVHQVHSHLYADGGVIAQCEFGPGANPENVYTVFETWDNISDSIKHG